MAYKLIRIDPIHRIFELRFVDEVSENIEISDHKVTDPYFIRNKNLCETKIPVLFGDKIVYDGNIKTKYSDTLKDVGGAKDNNKVIVNYKKFSGSYKPFWLEYENKDGIKVIETSMIPESKSLKMLRENYKDYVECYNNKDHMTWFISKILKGGVFGGFHIKDDGCVYNKFNKLIYEFDRFE